MKQCMARAARCIWMGCWAAGLLGCWACGCQRVPVCQDPEAWLMQCLLSREAPALCSGLLYWDRHGVEDSEGAYVTAAGASAAVQTVSSGCVFSAGMSLELESFLGWPAAPAGVICCTLHKSTPSLTANKHETPHCYTSP
jgi:hypothetical protein